MPGPAIPIIVGGILLREAAKRVMKRYLKKKAKDAARKLRPRKGKKICKGCAQRVKCFKKPKNAKDDEFDRQLQMQEQALNDMSPDELQAALKNFSGRPNDAAARAAERATAYKDISGALDNELRSSGVSSFAERDRMVKSEMGRIMKGVDAIHTLDWVAGGSGDMSGVGDRSANRSLGSQLKERRTELMDMAKDAKSDDADRMNIKLKKC